jgi:hypothetical protein
MNTLFISRAATVVVVVVVFRQQESTHGRLATGSLAPPSTSRGRGLDGNSTAHSGPLTREISRQPPHKLCARASIEEEKFRFIPLKDYNFKYISLLT